MDLYVESRGERRKTLISAILLALIVGIVVPPAVEAAVQRVRVTGVVRTNASDSTGDQIESKAIGVMGLSSAPGSDGAVAVRNYAGGGGFLGAGDCGGPLPDAVTITAGPSAVITALILTGTDGTITVTTPFIPGGIPVLNFHATPESPNVFFGLGNGLSVNAADITFTCTAGVDAQFVVLGQ